MTGATGEDTSASPTLGGGVPEPCPYSICFLYLWGGGVMIWRYDLTRVLVMLAPVRV